MASKARKELDRRDEVRVLLDLHNKLDRVSERESSVLRGALIVYFTAGWEAYCEDLAREAFDHLRSHAPGFLSGRTKDAIDCFHTPNGEKVDDLFKKTIGLKRVTDHWGVSSMSAEDARKQLRVFIKLRGQIAHGVRTSVGLDAVVEYRSLIHRLAARTGARVNSHVRSESGRPLYLPWNPALGAVNLQRRAARLRIR